VKINWDASIDKGQSRIRVGVIARDHKGEVLEMCCTSKNYCTDSTMAEAYVAWMAVGLAIRLDVQNSIFEGDSLEVIQPVQKVECCWTTYDRLLTR
jgi:hypothetical protein